VYEHKFNGFIRGYRRRFHQVDTYHRGTENYPGRCALIEKTGDDNDIVHGTCYLVKEDEVDEILNGLDKREKTYVKAMESVYLATTNTISRRVEICAARAVVYACHPSVGTTTTATGITTSTRPTTTTSTSTAAVNKSCRHHQRPQQPLQLQLQHLTSEERSLDYTARIIATSVGHSGSNFDYLDRLYHSLKNMNGLDDYMIQLYDRVLEYRREAQDNCNNTSGGGGGGGIYNDASHKVTLLQAPVKGCVFIDSGAVSALSNKGKALLPCGITSVSPVDASQGFNKGDVIEIKCRCTMKTIAIGIANYSSSQIDQIKGKHSKFIWQVINPSVETEHHTEMSDNNNKSQDSPVRKQNITKKEPAFIIEHVVSQECMVLC